MLAPRIPIIVSAALLTATLLGVGPPAGASPSAAPSGSGTTQNPAAGDRPRRILEQDPSRDNLVTPPGYETGFGDTPALPTRQDAQPQEQPRDVANAIVSDDVSRDGLVAHLFRPASPGPHPGVLLLGGSGGGIGWQDQMAERLARRGFAAMALAYFGMEGLPDRLECIPLEYVEGGLDALIDAPDVDGDRIAIAGASKGGELALLIASRRPEVRAVVAFVPSGVVFQSITPRFDRSSSWCAGGEEVPYVPYGQAPDGSPIVAYYDAGLDALDDAALEAATIPVERINGPILMFSGRDDNLWPSTRLSEMVIERLEAKGFGHAVEHHAYENAGHLISSIRDDVTRRGGTDEGNRAAQVDAQRRFVEFLTKHLGA